MARPRLAAVAALLVLTVSAAGCSDDDRGPSEPSPSATATLSPSASVSASATVSATPSSTSGSTTPPPPQQPQTVQKDVADNSFPDGTFTIRAGDTVTWTHRGSNLHSVTSAGNFDSHPNCPPVCMLGGQTFSHTFEAPGTFQYGCKIHGSMTGTITVTA